MRFRCASMLLSILSTSASLLRTIASFTLIRLRNNVQSDQNKKVWWSIVSKQSFRFFSLLDLKQILLAKYQRLSSPMSSKKTMTLRCPKCKYPFEATIPDSLHQACRTEKPTERNVDGDIIEQIFDCRNPQCLVPVTVCCYRQKGFFKRAQVLFLCLRV